MAGTRADVRRRSADRASPSASTRDGFTILEVVFVMVVLAIALTAFSRSLVGSMALNEVNRESALARDGLRSMLEVLSGSGDFANVFRRYNADPLDDPPIGASPGNAFAVAGLQPVDGDPDGMVGEIVFPGIGVELYEDMDLPELGMPRDLNADGVVDALDHSGDYRLLPVILRLQWRGQSGNRSAEIRTILANR